MGREDLLFWRKEAKDFYVAVAVLSGYVRQNIKVFWFFFSKKNCFLPV
jgi:hypothetical protein